MTTINVKELTSEADAVRLTTLLHERGRDSMSEEAWNTGIGQIKRWRTDNPLPVSEVRDGPLLTSPMPTGIERIDKEGQTVIRRVPKVGSFPEDIPSLDDLRPDHPDRLKQQRANEGVDMTTGGPFKVRAQLASTPTARQQGDDLVNFVASYRDALPEDLKDDAFMYDQLLQDWLFLQPDKEEEGKWRYTTMEGTGIELGDWADMMDPAELLSLAGSIGGTILTPAGKVKMLGKIFTLGRQGPQARIAATGFVGGLSGRALGVVTETAVTYMRNGSYPTYDELKDLGLTGAQIEAFATVAGELGAKILRTASHLSQDALARARGREGVFTDPRLIDEANANIRQTQQDMRRMTDTLGYPAMWVTPGTASHSIEIIAKENQGVADASEKIRRKFRRKEAQGKRGLKDYIRAVWHDDNVYGTASRENIIIAANDAVGRAGKVAVAQTEDGIVHFAPRGRAFEGQAVTDLPKDFGVHVNPEGDVWRVKSSRLIDKDTDLTRAGIGTELYKAAHEEAQANGAKLVSDFDVSEAAAATWEKLGKESGVVVKKNPNAVLEDGMWHADGPVYEVVQQRSYTEALLEHMTGKPPARVGPHKIRSRKDEAGRFEAVPESEEFSRFLRKPSRVELGAIEADTAANPFIMQKFKQAILDDYDTSVLVKGKQGRMEVDPVAFEAWYAETKGTIERFFTPEEMLHVNRPGGIYHVVQRQARNLQQSGEQINKIIDIDLGTKSLLKEENQRALWNQISGLNGGQQRQLFRLLDNVPGVPRGELGDQVRNIVRQEMQEDLLSKTKGKNVEGFNKWLNVVVPPKGGGIIRNLWPAEASEYIASLKLLRHTLQRRTDRGMVVGRGADVNPTGLAATRVIFGPLSRIQRGISALRRGQVRGGAAKASSLVSDPEALKLFEGIYVHRVASVDVARVVQDLGGWDLFPVDITEYIPGFPEGREGEEFDANNPEHRQAVSDYVMDKLALDPSIEPEATPPKQRFNFRYEN